MLFKGLLEELDNPAVTGELLSGWMLIGLRDSSFAPHGALVTYRQGSSAALLHHRLVILADLYQNIQCGRSHHPRRDVLLIGAQQGLVGGRKDWLQYRNWDLVLLHLRSVIGPLGPLFTVFQAVLPIAPATTLTAPRNEILLVIIKRSLQNLEPAEIIPHTPYLGSEHRAFVHNCRLVCLKMIDLPPRGL